VDDLERDEVAKDPKSRPSVRTIQTQEIEPCDVQLPCGCKYVATWNMGQRRFLCGHGVLYGIDAVKKVVVNYGVTVVKDNGTLEQGEG
jgi:hypothetical protein